ncbi:hypothetical protein E5288_WYG022789 [Bos mutus]|uniref:Uncharacterized protein n=1 Tax=Bos mutus TaxID=72004 RepID=A0A6B0R1I9_9CETA|nr:hypothetical protein [Bos mutus]
MAAWAPGHAPEPDDGEGEAGPLVGEPEAPLVLFSLHSFPVIERVVLRSVMGQPLFSFSENGDRRAVGLACQGHRIGVQSHAPHSRTLTIIRGGRAKQKGKMQSLLS